MAQRLLGDVRIGLVDADLPGVATLAMSASTTRLLFMFVPFELKTLSKVKFFVSAVAGTLGANDIVCELWSMPTGNLVGSNTAPSALIESRNTVTTTPTGAAWVEVTGYTGTSALTAGTLYALVISNANGTPSTNNFTVRWTTNSQTTSLGSLGAWGWAKKHSTDGGTTYATAVGFVGGIRLEFSDATFIGIPVENASVTAVGDGVYADRELGVKFTTPADVRKRVRRIGTRINVFNTPTGQPRYRIYRGTALVGTSEPAPQRSTTNYLILPVLSTVILEPSTIYRVVLGETTQSDASTNRFNLYEYTVENNANSKALMPFGGWVKTYWDGTQWIDTDTSSLIFFMELDTEDQFDGIPEAACQLGVI